MILFNLNYLIDLILYLFKIRMIYIFKAIIQFERYWNNSTY